LVTPTASSPAQMKRPSTAAQMKDATPWSMLGGRGGCTAWILLGFGEGFGALARARALSLAAYFLDFPEMRGVLSYVLHVGAAALCFASAPLALTGHDWAVFMYVIPLTLFVLHQGWQRFANRNAKLS
jgi:ABC-type uncharacterized transport system YnjBCD permease subunit